MYYVTAIKLCVSVGSWLTAPLTVHLVLSVHEAEAAVAGIVAFLVAVDIVVDAVWEIIGDV